MEPVRIVSSMVLACALVALAPAGRAADAPPDRTLQLRLDAVKADPNEPRNHFNLGLEYYSRASEDQPGSPTQVAMLEKAAAAFQQALKAGKKDKEAHEQIDLSCFQVLGNISIMLKKYGDAVDWFEKGIKNTPTDPMCLFGRGQGYYLNRKFSDAREAFEAYLKATTGNPKAREQAPQALTYLGAMAMETRKYEEAAGYFRQVIQEFPKESKEASRNLSLVLVAQGDTLKAKKQLAEAARLYDEAVAADRSHEDAVIAAALAHFELGHALVTAKEADKKASGLEHLKIAEADFKRATGRDAKYKDDYRAWFQLGFTQFLLEKFEDMIASYKRSLEIDPNQPDARYNLALALHRKGAYEDALQQAEMAKSLNKDDPAAANMVQKIFDDWQEELLKKASEAFTADRVLEAINFWEQVLKLNPRQPDAPKFIEQARVRLAELRDDHLKRGDAAFKAGDLLTATTEWNAVLALDPQNAEAPGRLKKVTGAKRVEALRADAAAAFRARNYATALMRVNEALAASPTDAASRKLKAQIQTAQSSGAKAVAGRIRDYLKRDRLKEARREVEAALEAQPDDKTIGLLRQTVNKRIEDTVARLKNEAQAAQTAGNKDLARQKFEAILALVPNDKEAAEGYKKVAKGEAKAVVSAEQVKSLNKKGIFAYMQNDLAGAKRAWEEALALDPENTEIRRSLERVNQKLKASKGAA
ncbi:MAG: tetratricopeptide repeat protein [Candidatus Coatesbacteria bacterium]